MRMGWLVAAMVMGCAGNTSAIDASIDAPLSNPGAPVDAPVDATPDAGCDPGCHTDCFGGSTCLGGYAYAFPHAPVPCCKYGEPWPYPGLPICAFPFGRIACEGGQCATPDPRYAECLRNVNKPVPGGDSDELLALHCPQGRAKQIGSPCDNDLDCRPAAEGISRLRCDLDSHACATDDTRPPPPTDYGAPCGVNPEQWSFVSHDEFAVFGSACETQLCQIARIDNGCLQQGCTMPCLFDEDCPEGSICLCDSAGYTNAFCAEATDRTTVEGRSAGLAACPGELRSR